MLSMSMSTPKGRSKSSRLSAVQERREGEGVSQQCYFPITVDGIDKDGSRRERDR